MTLTVPIVLIAIGSIMTAICYMSRIANDVAVKIEVIATAVFGVGFFLSPRLDMDAFFIIASSVTCGLGVVVSYKTCYRFLEYWEENINSKDNTPLIIQIIISIACVAIWAIQVLDKVGLV